MTDRQDDRRRARERFYAQWGAPGQEIPTGYLADDLARPVHEVAAIVEAADAEREHRRGGDRMRGILQAGLWLAQEQATSPIYREARAPLRAVILEELDIARRVAVDEDAKPDWRDTDLTAVFAAGVVEMLTYASDPDAPAPRIGDE